MDLRRLKNSIEIRELCYFVALAEELHLGRASQRLAIEPSPLSKAITLMEERLGVQLFVRTKKSTQLASGGIALLEDARKILGQVAETTERVRSCGSGRTLWVQVAMDEGMAHPRIARLLAKSLAEEPKVKIFTSQVSRESQVAQLQDDEIDVGLFMSTCSDPVHSDGSLVAVPLWEDPMVLAMPPDHPLAEQSVIHSLGDRPEELLFVTDATCHPALGELLSDSRRRDFGLAVTSSVEQVLTQVAFKGSLGVLGAAQVETIQRDDVVFRPLGPNQYTVTTFIVRRQEQHARSEAHGAVISRFVERAQQMAHGLKVPGS